MNHDHMRFSPRTLTTSLTPPPRSDRMLFQHSSTPPPPQPPKTRRRSSLGSRVSYKVSDLEKLSRFVSWLSTDAVVSPGPVKVVGEGVSGLDPGRAAY